MNEEWKNILKIDDEIEKFRRPVVINGIKFKNQEAADLYNNNKLVFRDDRLTKHLLMVNRRDSKITKDHIYAFIRQHNQKVKAESQRQENLEEQKRLQEQEQKRLSAIEEQRRVSRSKKPTNEDPLEAISSRPRVL